MLKPEVIALVEERLAEKLLKSVKITSWSSLNGGCISQSVKLVTTNGTFFMKWNNSGPSDLFIREAEGLTTLRRATTLLHIPEVLIATAINTNQPGLLVLEFLPLAQSTPTDEEKLGQGLAQLHRETHESHGFFHDNYCGETLQNNQWNNDWVDFFGQQRIWHLVRLIKNRRGLSGQDEKVFERLLRKLPDLIGHDPLPALNHGDLWSGNCLFSVSGPTLIDPACYFADREFDLALMDMFGGFSRRVWAAYQEAYPCSSNWKERVSLYQLYHYLNHYYLFGGSYGETALSIANGYI